MKSSTFKMDASRDSIRPLKRHQFRVRSSKHFLPFVLALFMLPALNMKAADITATTYEVPSKEAIAHMTTAQKEARIAEIKARVEEIKSMDKSHMTKEERKALRRELKGMHKEARAITGVYISIGALIIIILLLIIIL